MHNAPFYIQEAATIALLKIVAIYQYLILHTFYTTYIVLLAYVLWCRCDNSNVFRFTRILSENIINIL